MKYVILALSVLLMNFNEPGKIARLESQASANPNNWQVRLKLAEIFLNQANFSNAQKYLMEAQDIYNVSSPDSCSADLSYLWGLNYDYQDNIPKAIDYYNNAIACDSLCGKAWRKLGYLHEVFSNAEQMLYCFRKALAGDGPSAGLHYDIGVAYDMLDSLPQAIASYQKALALTDTLPEAYLNMGVDLAMLGHPDSANYYFALAAKGGLETPELYYNIGVMMADSGKIDEAIENFMKVLALDPRYSPAKLRLGDLYESLGDSGMAKVYYEDFVQTATLLYSDDVTKVKDKLSKYPHPADSLSSQ